VIYSASNFRRETVPPFNNVLSELAAGRFCLQVGRREA